MKNLFLRTISGIIYVAVIVASILFTQYTFLPLYILCGLLISSGIYEFHRLTLPTQKKTNTLIVISDILGGIALLISTIILLGEGEQRFTSLLPITSYFIYRAILLLYQPKCPAPQSLSASFASIIYVAFPICTMLIFEQMTNARMILAIFIFLWGNDTGAYCIGSLIGRHRLFQRVSPKKSWEGFFGGLVANIFIAYILYYVANEFFAGPQLTVWCLMAIIVSIFGTFGDLVESQLKRSAQVKDSGNIIPGHGGVLDRIDSFLLAMPATVLLLPIIMHFIS